MITFSTVQYCTRGAALLPRVEAGNGRGASEGLSVQGGLAWAAEGSGLLLLSS